MPIKEFVALTVIILGGIYVTHPFDFQSQVRKVKLTILKEISRTNNWGDPSFGAAKKYIREKAGPQLKVARRAQESTFCKSVESN